MTGDKKSTTIQSRWISITFRFSIEKNLVVIRFLLDLFIFYTSVMRSKFEDFTIKPTGYICIN